ncbi:acyl carrier protein [Phycisphaera mikurensis]|uniref:Carrier domain-containing protein n=1 Tax=Phycisphaera mikurensis (strain NBRC 102666 / KCTC 22515 / FYK2301M01) TaxID=1142394 RepID=I0IGY8_PHYMF|nr:acyl carrier protein [Phycisphaera mikurensis]MBB6440783.1 hypothetical protein [Phycisphaera mikurensis]BAM04526.1 hypothetical protein PSMK_23670 [Phycisphaera mikurensis NBRC 102666]
MGLGTVELTLDVEARFGILIPAAEASSVVTVADLLRLIEERLQGDSEAAERSARDQIAERWRRATTGRTGGGNASMPDFDRRPLDVLGPRELRRFHQKLIDDGFYPPELRPPAGTRPVLRTLWVGFPLAAAAASWAFFRSVEVVPGAIIVGLCPPALATLAARRLPHRPPEGWTRFGDVAAWLATASASSLPPGQRPAAEQVWPELRRIVAWYVGVRPEEVRSDHRLVDDLGLD